MRRVGFGLALLCIAFGTVTASAQDKYPSKPVKIVVPYAPGGATDIVADRIVGKPYLEFEIDRDRIARYGVSVRDVQDVIEIAIGGMNIMESVEGRERYPIRVRYLREFREDIPELEKILVPSSTGAQIPLAQVLTIKSVLGPQEIKGERGLLLSRAIM